MNDDARSRLSVVVLTFNSEHTIGATLASAARVSSDLHVVDSGSTDRTREIAMRSGARIAHHPFETYAASRNWAIETLPLAGAWELHLDADERLSDELACSIATVLRGPEGRIDGYFIPRLTRFHGRDIRHGGMYPIWHMRLFKRGHGRVEARRYDQHFIVGGATGQIDAPMIDDVQMPYAEFLRRHRRWAAAEAEEVLSPSPSAIRPRADGTPIERQIHRRMTYYKAPVFLRAFALFFYRFVLKLGFRDGVQGTAYYVMQTLFYRLMVDAEIVKRRWGIRGMFRRNSA
jgi:glycosyltransferase involved in cell wall biosynthesis